MTDKSYPPLAAIIYSRFTYPWRFTRVPSVVLSVMANNTYLQIIPYSQHCFLWNFVFYSRKAYLAHQYKKMLYHPWSYRITIDENPIPLRQICVLSYLCLLLTKVLFETSFKSFQYNTKGRRLSNYSIKLILCSHYRSRYNIRGCVKIKNMDFTNIQREVTFAPHIWPNTLYALWGISYRNCIKIRQND